VDALPGVALHRSVRNTIADIFSRSLTQLPFISYRCFTMEAKVQDRETVMALCDGGHERAVHEHWRVDLLDRDRERLVRHLAADALVALCPDIKSTLQQLANS
jgi:hypothetical protein